MNKKEAKKIANALIKEILDPLDLPLRDILKGPNFSYTEFRWSAHLFPTAHKLSIVMNETSFSYRIQEGFGTTSIKTILLHEPDAVIQAQKMVLDSVIELYSRPGIMIMQPLVARKALADLRTKKDEMNGVFWGNDAYELETDSGMRIWPNRANGTVVINDFDLEIKHDDLDEFIDLLLVCSGILSGEDKKIAEGREYD